MAVLQTKNQIQPKWPLRIDQSVGPYASVDSVAESLKQDFIFLLQTIPGEWPMNPDLGVGLATYLFESPGSLEALDIKTNIQNQLRKYLPNITLLDAKFRSTPEQQDSNESILTITYAINDLGLKDEIDFGLDNTKKTMVTLESLNSKVGGLL
jgi:phage baseplate assembly protein W